MKNNFVITGMPRSGTKFLAQVMNRSKVFTVLHDHKIDKMPKRYDDWDIYYDFANNRLDQENYGEVTGWYRDGFKGIKAEKRGIILRHPIKNIISLYNMNGAKYSKMYLDIFESELKNLDELAQLEDVRVIKFQDMTKDLDYLRDVLEYFGVTDVDVDDSIINNKVNRRGSKFTYDNFDKDIMQDLEKKCKWFVDKYELKLI